MNASRTPDPNRIPLIDMEAVNGPDREALRAAFERVADSGDFGCGAEVAAFEAALGQAVQSEHVVGVSSGTSAISMGLAAAGVGAGDEVLMPANTFFATASAAVAVGAKPVAVEIDPATALIDLAAAAAAVTDRTVALAVVHLYGNPVDMSSARSLATRHGLLLLEDAAQALGASWTGQPVGSLADISTFSFYPTKNLGALGQAGAVCTPRADIAHHVRTHREQGSSEPNCHTEWGGNERMHGMQAAFLRVKLARLAQAQAQRSAAARRYDRLLEEVEGVRRYVTDARGVHAHHLYAVSVDDRDEVRARLDQVGIGTAVHYPVPIHHQPVWRADLPVPDLPHAERHAASTVSLPFWPGMDDVTVERVVSELAGVIAERQTGAGTGSTVSAPSQLPLGRKVSP